MQRVYWALLGFIIACKEVSKFKAYNIGEMNERLTIKSQDINKLYLKEYE